MQWFDSKEKGGVFTVRMEGPDAFDFLHRITTANLKKLEVGKGCEAAILTPQGKYDARFSLWMESKDAFLFLVTGGIEWKDRLIAVLDRYTFGEKIKVTANSAPCFWGVGELPSEVQLEESTFKDGIFRMQDSFLGRPWIFILGPRKPYEEMKIFDQLRVEALFPWPGQEIQTSVNPFEAGDSIAVAENKGCYPGQEIIEKIAALGSPAKRLIRFRWAKESSAVVQSEANAPTTVTDEGGLAIVKKTLAKTGTLLQFPGGMLAEVEATSGDWK